MAKNLILKVAEKGAKKTASALKSVGGAVSDIGKKASIATAGIGLLSTKLAGDFQKNLFEVGTLMKDFNNVQLKQMSKELRNVASSSGLALGSISKAKYDIVSAGFSNAADSAEVLEASAQLAVGGVTSAAEAADLLTTSLNAMGLEAGDVTRVSDELFTTVRLGKTTMGELSSTLGQLLPFASSAGLELSGVGAAMATLTASGISTAQATTSLRSAIQSLQSPTDTSKTLMRDMGIEIKRFDDGSFDLVNTIKQFDGLDPDTMKKLIPRIEGILAIQTMSQNFKTLEKNVSEFSKTSGAAEKAFKQMSSAFNTQMSMLKNNISSVMIEIGDVLISIFDPMIKSINLEFSRLGVIGFDNLGLAVKNQLPVILETLKQVISITLDNIDDRLDLTAKKITDSLNPFSDMSENIERQSKAIEEKTKASNEVISLLFKKMYSDITEEAEMSAMRTDIVNENLKNSHLEKLKEELDALQENIDNKTLIIQNGDEAEESSVVKRNEFLSVFGLAQKQAYDKITERENELILLGVSKTDAEREGTKMRLQFMSQEVSSKTNQASSFLGLAKQASGQNKKNALQTKGLAKAEAYVKAFEAANKTFAQFGGFPAGVVPAGLALAIGLENVKAIDSQKFASGGIVQGSNTGQGDTVPAMLTPGELILNQSQQDNLANQVGGLTINFSGPVTNDDYVRDFIIPQIDKVVRGNLA